MTSETPANPATHGPERASAGAAVTQLIRAAIHLLVVISVTLWGFLTWPSPWFVLAGIGFGLFSVLLWALFLSPRPVLRTDRFGQALIELLFIAAGVGAALGLGVFWVPVLAVGLLGAVTGYISGSRAPRPATG